MDYIKSSDLKYLFRLQKKSKIILGGKVVYILAIVWL